MQEIEYIFCFYHTIFFSCSKRCKIKFYRVSNNTKAAKISALLSGKLEKNEYLAGKDLALKPGPTEKIQINISISSNYYYRIKK